MSSTFGPLSSVIRSLFSALCHLYLRVKKKALLQRRRAFFVVSVSSDIGRRAHLLGISILT
jgi:hypothetical protein